MYVKKSGILVCNFFVSCMCLQKGTLIFCKNSELIIYTIIGRLIVLGLCKQKMTCDEIDDFYDDMANKVFINSDSFLTKLKFIKSSMYPTTGALDTKKFESIIKDTVGSAPLFDEKKIDFESEPKCAVITTLANNSHLPTGILLRSYDVKSELSKHSPNAINDPNYALYDGYVEQSSKVNYLISGISDCKHGKQHEQQVLHQHI